MLFSIVGLLLSLALVGWLVGRQLQPLKTQAPASQTAAEAGASAPAGNQVQQVQRQLEQTLAHEAAARASAADQ